MKKLLVILLAILLIFCCTSCAKKRKNNSGSLQLNSSSSVDTSNSTFSDGESINSNASSSNISDSKSVSSSLISGSSIENSSSSESLNSNISNNSSQINSSSSEPLYSYTLTLDPESESQYITVKMYLGDKEVTQAKVGEKVTIVITSSDGVRRAIGVVAINGTTVFSSTLYEQEVSGTVTMVEGGLQIYVKLILQNNYS